MVCIFKEIDKILTLEKLNNTKIQSWIWIKDKIKLTWRVNPAATIEATHRKTTGVWSPLSCNLTWNAVSMKANASSTIFINEIIVFRMQCAMAIFYGMFRKVHLRSLTTVRLRQEMSLDFWPHIFGTLLWSVLFNALFFVIHWANLFNWLSWTRCAFKKFLPIVVQSHALYLKKGWFTHSYD